MKYYHMGKTREDALESNNLDLFRQRRRTLLQRLDRSFDEG